MSLRFRGNAITIPGEHINIDTAMGWYLGMDALPPAEIAKKFMCMINPDIANIAKKKDILLGGRDFGYGKVHASFFIAMREIGIESVVAESFATQMIHQSLMYGLFLVECPYILKTVEMGDVIEVDIESAVVMNYSKNKCIEGNKMPRFLIDVMSSGGQLGYLARKVSSHTFY